MITAHLSGELEQGLYPLLDGDGCCWLAADFNGPAAMLDALAYLFFTAPFPAATARQVGSGLLREAIAVRGRMDLGSYDRLFPSQDVFQVGGPGNPPPSWT